MIGKEANLVVFRAVDKREVTRLHTFIVFIVGTYVYIMLFPCFQSANTCFRLEADISLENGNVNRQVNRHRNERGRLRRDEINNQQNARNAAWQVANNSNPNEERLVWRVENNRHRNERDRLRQDKINNRQNAKNAARQAANNSNLNEYDALCEHVNNLGNDHNVRPWRVLVLPSTYLGNPRALKENFEDAIAIIKKYGKPDLFIIFTCKPKWCKITDNLYPGQSTSDRPDLIT
ncbi:glycosyltransferase-like protein gnt14 [Hydra vulgaris]|uniref:Glycosyltransferase-like protein gnt14 n=1 Tax=Hydra vulgaris TaxID=6087 RepID=A0ABM4B1B0_HYDVU